MDEGLVVTRKLGHHLHPKEALSGHRKVRGTATVRPDITEEIPMVAQVVVTPIMADHPQPLLGTEMIGKMTDGTIEGTIEEMNDETIEDMIGMDLQANAVLRIQAIEARILIPASHPDHRHQTSNTTNAAAMSAMVTGMTPIRIVAVTEVIETIHEDEIVTGMIVMAGAVQAAVELAAPISPVTELEMTAVGTIVLCEMIGEEMTDVYQDGTIETAHSDIGHTIEDLLIQLD